ncbi:MAG: hypothetical protein P0Y55_12855 [Candidatus Cohnella colombiensis]|uniref:Uncharacterized protein n=1 Tax=Candidatus Cohnella colombiensis TaxID=3121368 RepID=A0AA95JC28_9BACL|nr:MAG: hypothetical protein P0Y55_12855 [Cohnella sp.]
MVLKRILNDEFDQVFNGTIILDSDIEDKLHSKHKVYRDDLEDALGDPYRVVLKPKQKSKTPTNQFMSSGNLYEISCETSDGRVLFIVTRLFNDGNLYIITAYWATADLKQIYYQESEVLRDE